MRRRFIQRNGELHEITEENSDLIAPMIQPDIEPYQSMIDGSMIESRSEHREHLYKHGYQEVGNDSSLYKAPTGIPEVSPQKRKELIASQIAQLREKDFKAMHKRAIDEIKWNSRNSRER